MKEYDYIIIGAGISGLTVAEQLQGTNHLVIERENQVGGYCRTIMQDGYIWDYAGHFFHFREKSELHSFEKIFSKSEYVKVTKKSKIVYKNKMISYPFQDNIHELDANEFKECAEGLKNAKVKAEYSSFLDMLYSKYGSGIVDKFLKPYNEKLYVCNLEQLDVNAMGRFFPSNIAEKSNKKSTSYNEQFYYLLNGSGYYIQKIAYDEKKVVKNCQVAKIDIENKILKTVGGENYKYRTLVSTIPLNSLMTICRINSKIKMTYNKVLVFNIGFDSKTEVKDCHWLYIPDKTINFYRVGFYDNVVPNNRGSIYVEIAFAEKQVINIETEFKSVIEGLKKIGIIKTQKIVSYNYIIMNPGYVHVNQKSYIDALCHALEKHDVYSIGRYGSWTYNSMEDCIIEAKKIAKKIVKKV